MIWFPLIPLGSYRVRRKYRAKAIRLTRALLVSDEIAIVRKRPFDLRQVLTTYLWAVGGTAIGVVVFGAVMYFVLS